MRYETIPATTSRLLAVRALLLPYRWGKRAPERYGCICLEEALRRAGGGLEGSAARLIRKVIKTEDIWVWNDEPRRTYGDVLAAIDAAIELSLNEPSAAR